MALSKNDQITVRGYLLGHLSEGEQEKLEERLITDEEFFDELEISKEELIEEYQAGELAQKDRQWFESHYLASPKGRMDYTFVAAMDCIEKPVTVPSVPKPSSFFEQLSSIFRVHRLKFAGVGLSALMVILVAGLLRPGPQNSLAVTLNSTASRRNPSDTKVLRVTINPDVSELRITLTLPEPASQPTNYRAELDDRTQTKPVTLAGHDDSSVVAVIPATQLPAGYYALRLYAMTPSGKEQRIPGDYFFIVERN
jgi:hypothetical protein